MTSKKACFVVNQYEFLKQYTKRKVPENQMISRTWEGAQSDSNRRHSEPQSDALTN